MTTARTARWARIACTVSTSLCRPVRWPFAPCPWPSAPLNPERADIADGAPDRASQRVCAGQWLVTRQGATGCKTAMPILEHRGSESSR